MSILSFHSWQQTKESWKNTTFASLLPILSCESWHSKEVE